MSSGKSIEATYQKKTQLEHILLRPDTYVGSIERCSQTLWVLDDSCATTTKRFVEKDISVVPGLFKIFDEILVNAIDHKQRDPSMSKVAVDIDEVSGSIRVWNNGSGVPVVVHAEHKVYVPEMIFGHLLTSSNYDDSEKKVTGGRNGYGAKLANIFSKKFIVETTDMERGLQYRQEFRDNMSVIDPPVVKPVKPSSSKKTAAAAAAGGLTCITFFPDLARFGMTCLDPDTVALMKKRVYDVAGTTDRSVQVVLNGVKVPISGFKDYVGLYLSSSNNDHSTTTAATATDKDADVDADVDVDVDVDVTGDDGDGDEAAPPPAGAGNGSGTIINNKPTTSTSSIVYARLNERWEIALAVSDNNQFRQVSFVNGVCTTRGGQHVMYIADQVAEAIAKSANVKSKRAKGMEIKAAHVRNHMWVFVNCLIENPAFDSQTKETLTTRLKQFGSTAVVPESMFKAIGKKGLMEHVLLWARLKESATLVKKSGVKRAVVSGIPKLDDANFAGTAKGDKCTLILTEGDSAKALAVSGLGVVGRDFYGVFPLRGKLLNARDCPQSKMLDNAEIKALVDILGLKFGTQYTCAKALRYGHVMIMADQDHDGSHIKGLVINFLHAYWPSLFSIPGFLCEFITPIVKCSKGAVTQVFYTMPEYSEWMKKLSTGSSVGGGSSGSSGSSNTAKGWTIKYYKGLGTSTSVEAKQYFTAIQRHRIEFVYEGARSDASIRLAFDKSLADARKGWLQAFVAGTHVDYSSTSMTYSDFVDQELVLFSLADNVRSIPSCVDGFKPSQRKVLYACLRRKLKEEIKVAQLAGYVSEHTMYHHGEQSLNATIVNMAQNYVGSNNINLLHPSGQFGTRLMGGKDAASPRYIFTRLSCVTRLIFHEDDDDLLEYLEEDGAKIEPRYFVPVIPMVLVNGSDGIGTGWSTFLPNFDPLAIIHVLRTKIAAAAAAEATTTAVATKTTTDDHVDDTTTLLKPWYRGFGGTISIKSPTHFVTRGRAELRGEEVVITELPVGKWTQEYKQFLDEQRQEAVKAKKDAKAKKSQKDKEDLVGEVASAVVEDKDDGDGTTVPASKPKKKPRAATLSTTGKSTAHTLLVESLTEGNTDTTVQFKVRAQPVPSPDSNLFGLFRLETSFSMTNIHLFDQKGCIRKFEGPMDILDTFFPIRLHYYHLRKARLLEKLRAQVECVDAKARFVLMVVEGSLIIFKRPEKEVLADLVALKFPSDDGKFAYLMNMALWSFTAENVAKLQAERDRHMQELRDLEATSPETLWLRDLEALELCLVGDFQKECAGTVPDVRCEYEHAADAVDAMDAHGPAVGRKRKVGS